MSIWIAKANEDKLWACQLKKRYKKIDKFAYIIVVLFIKTH